MEKLYHIGRDKINNEIFIIDDSISQWQAFNSITESLTHNGKNFNTTMSAFAQTDRLFFA